MCLGCALLEPGVRHPLEDEDRSGKQMPKGVQEQSEKWKYMQETTLPERDFINSWRKKTKDGVAEGRS